MHRIDQQLHAMHTYIFDTASHNEQSTRFADGEHVAKNDSMM